jgi:leucyl aminopeptidase
MREQMNSQDWFAFADQPVKDAARSTYGVMNEDCGMKVAFAEIDLSKKGVIVVAVAPDTTLTGSAASLDQHTGGALTRALDTAKFKAKSGDLIDIVAPAGVAASRIIVLGIGKPKEMSAGKAADLGGGLAAHLLRLPEAQAQIILDQLPEGEFSTAELAAQIGFGAVLRSYRFDQYRSKLTAEDKPSLTRLTIASAEASAAKKRFATLEKLAKAVAVTRDLVTEPPNVIYPQAYADRVADLGIKGLDVEILGEKELRKLGMGALIGVAQGSVNPPRVVIMRWEGGTKGAAPVAFVGKGVTFDSGGLSLKTAKGMEDMKWDMAGSAAVVGTMMALASRGAKVNAVGVLGLVENMPSGSAQRPGDVVTSMSGQTIEVLNTDAEGRLVLADVLWYTIDRLKPVAVIDLATLTGAVIMALGHEHTGLFSNNDTLADAILNAGKKTGETVWRLPLGEAYDRLIKSDIADMKNIGDGTAGSITGAVFLQRFVKDVPWAHLDIAGTAWAAKDKPTVPKGATGWGVRLLNQMIADHYEGQ